MEKCTDIIAELVACFADHRDPAWVEHTVEELVAPRLLGLLLGYEDPNDKDALRDRPRMASKSGDSSTAMRRARVGRELGALIQITVRRMWLWSAGNHPYWDLFLQVYVQLRADPLCW